VSRSRQPGFPNPFPQFLCLKNSITKRACKSGPRIALFIGMDYEKMKALMETSREKSAAQRKSQVKEFPKPDSGPDRTYLGYDVAKERFAA
jgi:hypothetical protein